MVSKKEGLTSQGVRNLNTNKAPRKPWDTYPKHVHRRGKPYRGLRHPNAAFDDWEGWPADVTECVICGKILHVDFIF
jgi:hypothetical protein